MTIIETTMTHAPQKMISLPEVFLTMSRPYLLATKDTQAFWLDYSELLRQNRGLEMICCQILLKILQTQKIQFL